MRDPMEDIKDPAVPQPVKDAGAIDDATVPDQELDEDGDVVIFDRLTGEVRYRSPE